MRKPAAAAISIDALILDSLLDFVLSYEQLTRLIECVTVRLAQASNITITSATTPFVPLSLLKNESLTFTETSSYRTLMIRDDSTSPSDSWAVEG